MQSFHNFLLQEYGEELPDDHLLTIMFGASEGRVHTLFNERSAASRIFVFPHVNADLMYDEAVRYMHCHCRHLSNDTIVEIFDLVGGRFITSYQCVSV